MSSPHPTQAGPTGESDTEQQQLVGSPVESGSSQSTNEPANPDDSTSSHSSGVDGVSWDTSTGPVSYEWAPNGECIKILTTRHDQAAVEVGGHILRAREIARVTDGASQYRKVFGTGSPVDLPQFYSEFDRFDPIITGRSVAARGGAYGITATRLEMLVRLFTGGGRYRAPNLRITPSGAHPILIEDTTTTSDTGLLLQPAQMDITKPTREALPKQSGGYSPDQTGMAPKTSTAPFTVPEDQPDIQIGLNRVYTVLESCFGLRLARHISHDPRKQSHRFETASGIEITVPFATLASLKEGEQSPENIREARRKAIGEKPAGKFAAEELDYWLGDSLRRPRSAVSTIGFETDPTSPQGSRESGSTRTVVTYRAVCLSDPPASTDTLSVRMIKTREELNRQIPQ